MEFLNPGGLYALSFLPLLFLPYLIRGMPRRLVFSGLIFLKELSVQSRGSPWGRLRLPLLFFVQLLLLLLLALATGDPVLSVRPHRVGLVVDNSASMQAREGAKSRFEIALEEARRILDDLPANARIDLFVTVPALRLLGDEGTAPTAALRLLSNLRPYDVGNSSVEYGEVLSQLLRDGNYARLFFLTDRRSDRQGGRIRVVSVGKPQENLAIGDFHIRGPSLGASRLEARVEVINFSSRNQEAKIALLGGEKILARQSGVVQAGKNLAIPFKDFPDASFYEARIENNDALALDNRRYATPPALQGLSLLVVTPKPQSFATLRSIPGITLKVIPPEQYGEHAGGDHAAEFFHYSTPTALPEKPALFILPPEGNPLVSPGDILHNPVISSWREPHPVTRYVNFSLFRIPYSRTVKPLSFGEAVLESPQGPLGVAAENGGVRYLVLGFDPFPYLGERNLPVSIFTLNFLGWFQETVRSPRAATGQPLRLGSTRGEATIQDPEGESFSVPGSAGRFDRTFRQGVYRVSRGRTTDLIAVNLADVGESDLSRSRQVVLREVPEISEGFVASPFWSYLLLSCVSLLFLEWFLRSSALRGSPEEIPVAVVRKP